MEGTEKDVQLDESASTLELKGIKVLVVEDDNLIIEVVTRELLARGANIRSVLDGSKAIEEITRFMPNVILLDLMLPGVSGEEILKNLKADSALKSIPVIIFSNRSEDADIEKIKALGAVDFFVKVSTVFSDLAKAIQKHAQTSA